MTPPGALLRHLVERWDGPRRGAEPPAPGVMSARPRYFRGFVAAKDDQQGIFFGPARRYLEHAASLARAKLRRVPRLNE